MNSVRALLNQSVEIELSGRLLPIKGKLIDYGSDILVLFNGTQFLYISSIHIQYIMPAENEKFLVGTAPDSPFENRADSISFRKMLMNAKGMFVELFIAGDQSIHGYLTSIMNDFFVFYSPVFHNVFISMRHLKYLIPYSNETTPYSLPQEYFLMKPSSLSLARSFDQQFKKLEGQFLVLDLGENPSKIGLLKKVEEQSLELITAAGIPNYLHLEHVKTVHLPRNLL